MLFDVEYVITIHDEIIAEFGGLPGFAGGGRGGVESALARVEHHAAYAGVNDVFAVAALYAVALARGHVFNDGNKRTGLACALTYLDQQGIVVPERAFLEDVMVDVAEGVVNAEDLSDLFSTLWVAVGKPAPGDAPEF